MHEKDKLCFQTIAPCKDDSWPLPNLNELEHSCVKYKIQYIRCTLYDITKLVVNQKP